MYEGELITYPFEYSFNHNIILYAQWTGVVGGLSYTLFDNYATLNQYIDNPTLWTLPNEVEGLPITKIGDGAFMGVSTIYNITVGIYVTEIGDNAFKNCNMLTHINFPHSTINFGENVLTGSNNLTTLKISTKADLELKYLFGNNFGNIPISLTHIIYAAGGDGTLVKTLLQGQLSDVLIVTAEDMTNIPSNYFRDCTSLKKVLITNGVTAIGQDAFRNTSVQEVSFPSTLTIIHNRAFFEVTTLEYLDLQFTSLEYIKGDAFSGMSNLNTVILPSTIKTIEFYAFYNCSKLEYFYLPEVNDLYYIGNYAFYNNVMLSEFGYAPNLEYVGNYAFYNCTVLEEFILPDSVTYAGMNAFALCYRLFLLAGAPSRPTEWSESFNNAGRPIYWNFAGFANDSEFKYVLFKDNTAGVYKLQEGNISTSITFPTMISGNVITRIIAYAFVGNTFIASVTVPYTVMEIGSFSFLNASALTTVSFTGSSNLKHIRPYAFNNAESLSSIILPEGLLTIDLYSFRMTNLSSVIIPASVTDIGTSAFESCANLVSVTITHGSVLETIGNHAFASTKFDYIDLPNTLTSIGQFAFSNNYYLSSIVIPDSVTFVGLKAFYFNSSLNIYVMHSSKPAGWNADWNFDSNPVEWGVGEVSTNNNTKIVLLSDDTWAILTVIFKDETTLVIPTTINTKVVSSISKGALSRMNNLVNLTIPFVGSGYDAEGADALFGYIFGGVTYTGGTLTRQYYNVSDYKNYFIPTTLYSVTVQNASYIEYGAFYNCATLGWVYLNPGILYVGENAFKSCSLVTIYSGDLSEPETWHENWNPDSRPVNWGVV